MAASNPRLNLYSVHFNDPKNKYIDLALCHTSLEEFARRCVLRRPIKSIVVTKYDGCDRYLTPADDKDFYRVVEVCSCYSYNISIFDPTFSEWYVICLGLVKSHPRNMEFLPESIRFHPKFIHDAVVANNMIELTDAQNVLLAKYRDDNKMPPVDYYYVTRVRNKNTYSRERVYASISDIVIIPEDWSFDSIAINKLSTQYHLQFNLTYHDTNRLFDKFYKPNKYAPVESSKRVDITTPENVRIVLKASIKHMPDNCTADQLKFIENAVATLTKPIPTVPEPDPVVKQAEELKQKLEQFLTKVDSECGDLNQLYTSFNSIPSNRLKSGSPVFIYDSPIRVGNVFTYCYLSANIMDPAVPVECPQECMIPLKDKAFDSRFAVCRMEQKREWSQEMRVAMFVHWLWNNTAPSSFDSLSLLNENRDIIMVLVSVLNLTKYLLRSELSPAASRLIEYDTTKLMIKSIKAFSVIYDSTMSK